MSYIVLHGEYNIIGQVCKDLNLFYLGTVLRGRIFE